tara:strand:+ start:888 stop:1361 length:474 start_codon:yes stop_codon:yes gene_type:complete
MYRYNCIIRRVVDGDTVDVDIDLGFGIWKQKERIRLYGIDTPESRTSDAVEKIFGKEAARVVEHFLPVGSKQVMESIKDKAGKFGRTLGNFIIFDKEQDRETTINEFMIENNYAVGYHGQSKDSISQEHLDNYVELIKRKPELINEAYLNQYVNSRR